MRLGLATGLGTLFLGDAITITNGSGVETVTCDGVAHSSCYGTATIYGYLQSNGAGHSGSVTVTFEAP